MRTIKFSIGYNHSLDTLKLLDDYREKLEAFYFPMPQAIMGTGRYIPQSGSYPEEIPRIIKRCNSLNIKPQLLVNSTCEGINGLTKKTFSRVIDYALSLKSIGLKSIILTNPVYISQIKRLIPDVLIESSVNCYVRTVEHALYLKDLGIDVLTIDRDINHDIAMIGRIRDKTKLKIKIILNEGCVRHCPFRNMHYNYLSHGNFSERKNIDNTYIDKFGISLFVNKPEKMFRMPFIPPDYLGYYADIADYFKLSTRVFSTVRIKECLDAYVDRQYRGNLLNIIDSPCLSYFYFIDYRHMKNIFFEKISRCDTSCKNCNLCKKIFKKTVLVNPDFIKISDRQKASNSAIRIYNNLLRDSKKIVQPFLQIGIFLEKIRNHNASINIYLQVLKVYPRAAELYAGLSRSYFAIRRYKNAFESARKATALGYKDRDVGFIINSCYTKWKNARKQI